MKIVYVITDLSYSGVPKICIELCNFICKTDEVFLISLCHYSNDLLPLRRVNNKVKFISFYKKKGLNVWLFWELYRRLSMLKPDILHLHKIGLFYSIPYILTNTCSKIFYTVHSLANKDIPFYYRIFYYFLFRFFRVKSIPISRAVEESFRQIYKLDCKKTIYHGVNIYSDMPLTETIIKEITGYKNTPSTFIFITLARIAEEKNQHLLIESFNRLIIEGSDVLLLIIGDASKNALLEELKRLSGPQIFFLGSKDNVQDYLRLADAFCLTSVYEGLSLATIEALAMKVIPICTPVGGVPEVVKDGYNGILSEDCTVTSYLNALKRFLSMSEQEKQVMRENAFRTYKERFTIERCGKEYLKLYNDALQEK